MTAKREIRSFVRRAGRITVRQKQGLNEHLAHYVLKNEGVAWDFDAIFERKADTVVEIGFGMGASLLEMAKQNPNLNYVGIEVHEAGIGHLASGLLEEELTNVRIAPMDAMDAFRYCIKKDSLAGIQIFFPDPWPKKRHHKRRLVQSEFVSILVNALKLQGFLHCATDWAEYAEWMMEVLNAETRLCNQNEAGGFVPRPATRPYTKFEVRGEKLGHEVFDMIFTKT